MSANPPDHSQNPLPRFSGKPSRLVDQCLELLTEKTFRLRPARYDERFGLWPGEVGLELEMLPVRPAVARSERPALVPLHVPDARGEALAGALLPLAEREGWQCEFSGAGAAQRLMRIAVPGTSGLPDWVTFEPGGQIEFSSAPFPCLSDALRRLTFVRDKVARHLRGFGVELLQTGINPWYTPDEIGLQMDKPRYKAMNKYFSRIGPFGPRMMRQTCTVQVNLDFGSSEDELAKRYLVSLLVAPFAGATFANSPFVDGKDSGVKGFRSKVWLNLDPSRTGIAPLGALMKSLNRDACVRYYWDFAKLAKVVFVAGADYAVPDTGLTWEKWTETPWLGVSPTIEDFETHLSLLFPEVRPRGFLEQRPVDCQNQAWVAAPAGYYTGLLYDSRARDEAIALLEPFAADIEMVLHKVPEGFKNKDLADTSARLMEIAIEGLDRLPECFRGAEADLTLRRFYERFTARRRTPADDLIDAVNQGGFGLGSFLNVGNR